MRKLSGIMIAGLLASASGATAQTTLDEGTFRHMVDGRQVATETFSIKQTVGGADAVVIATGRVLYREGNRREMVTVVQTSGPTLRPTGYDLTVTGDSALRIRAQVTGTRVSARIVRDGGERAREFIASEGAVVTEDGIAHHAYFVAQRVQSGNGGRLPLIIPIEGRQVNGTATIGSAQETRIADATVTARRITLTLDGGTEEHIWIDDAGRVLRVEIPSESFVAERTALPEQG